MKHDRQDGKFSQVLKWVGYLTAIFSLCATLLGIAKYVYNRAETRKNLTALLATEGEQQKSRDYSSAWQTLEKAAKLVPDSPEVRAAQEKLAMLWLEDMHLQQNQTWSDVVQKLEPVLTRAVLTPNPDNTKPICVRTSVGPISSNHATGDLTLTPPAHTAKLSPRIRTIPTLKPCGATGLCGTTATASRKPRRILPPRLLPTAKMIL